MVLHVRVQGFGGGQKLGFLFWGALGFVVLGYTLLTSIPVWLVTLGGRVE